MSQLRHRVLVHWINSLPLTSCLLVESLRDLRFGDVLSHILQWIHNDFDHDYELREVVEFVAHATRSEDGDAMFLVNEPHCDKRIAAGEEEAIAAVVQILRRVLREKTEQQTPLYQTMNLPVRLQMTTKQKPKKKKKPFEPVTEDLKPNERVITVRRRRPRSPKKKTMSSNPEPEPSVYPSFCEQQQDGLRVFSMIDPTVSTKTIIKPPPSPSKSPSKQPSTQRPVPPPSPSNATHASHMMMVARRVCQWLQSLGIPLLKKLDDEKDLASIGHSLFSNGVLLCQLAAAMVHKHGGGISARHQLKPTSAKVFILAGAYPEPTTRAQCRHNTALAIQLLSELRLFTLSPFVHDSQALWSVVEANDPTIWDVLDHIRDHVMKFSAAPVVPMSKTLETMDENRRPFITKEQMRAVQVWLQSLEIDWESGGGVLQDPLRNGVLLCCVVHQVLSLSFVFYRQPKTLMQIRDNVVEALRQLTSSEEPMRLRLPSCYATAAAMEAMLRGDKQVIYGILWHLWQLDHRQRARLMVTHQSPPSSPVSKPPPPSPVTSTSKSPARVISSISPLLVDVPASALVDEQDQRSRRFQVKEAEEKQASVTLRWKTYDQQDDLVPKPSTQRKKKKNPIVETPDRPANPAKETKAAVPTIEETKEDEQSEPEPPKELIPVPPESEFAAPAMDSDQVDRLLQWLQRLGIRLRQPEDWKDPTARLSDFQSGELLCCLVEKVEHLRSLEGVFRLPMDQPLVKAKALHNITKALAILQRKKTMPLHLLRRQQQIFQGDRQVILTLLDQVRVAYGYHLTQRPRKARRPRKNQPPANQIPK